MNVRKTNAFVELITSLKGDKIMRERKVENESKATQEIRKSYKKKDKYRKEEN